MVYAQPSTCPRKWHAQTPVVLWYTNRSPNLGPKTRPYNNQQKKKKKKICKVVDFAVPADQRINLKESEKRDKYLDFSRELKKLWNMKVTIIPIVIGAFGTVTEGLLKRLEDLEVGSRVEAHKQQHYWKLPEYREESWILDETCCHSISSENHQLTLMWKTLMSNNNNNDNNILFKY